MKSCVPGPIRFGVFEYDKRTSELRKHGFKLRIEGQPLQVLGLLLDRAGDVVTREELQQRLWSADTFVSFEQGINTAVRRLREALGDSAQTPRYIETLPRRGYRFIYPLVAPPPPAFAPERRGPPLAAVAAAAILLAAAMVAIVVRPGFIPSGLARMQAIGVGASGTLSGQPAAAVGSRPSKRIDPAVSKALFRGNYFRAKRTRESLEKALDAYHQALDLDPTFAPAWNGIALTYTRMARSFLVSPADAWPKANAAVERALELDPNLADAHKSLAQIRLFYYLDWDGAEREAAIARQLDPNWPGDSFTPTLRGNFDQGIAIAKADVQRDPLNPGLNLILGWALFQAGRFDDSIVQLKKTIELDRRSPYAYQELGWNYVKKGMCSEAVQLCERARSLMIEQAEPGEPIQEARCGWVFASCGRRTDALRILRENDERRTRSWINPAAGAFIYDALGDHDRAVRVMWRSYENHVPYPEYYVCRMCSDALRASPEFQRFRRAIGPPEARMPASAGIASALHR